MLHNFRFKYPKHLLCDYLNINSLTNKIHVLIEIIYEIPLNLYVISESKLDDSFPNAQSIVNNYEKRARKDKEKYGGNLNEFVRKDH